MLCLCYNHVCRFMFGFGLLPSLCMVIVLCFLFETPRWLVHHGRVEKAFDVMRKIRNVECVERELDDIIKDYQRSQEKKLGSVYMHFNFVCVCVCVCVCVYMCTYLCGMYMYVCMCARVCASVYILKILNYSCTPV